ncbi:rod shape-determining protein MreD [Weizmannia acidilactici]|uniref:rod shape-determining protein MreD n=1 Tax=Weizmannia acidilactici TaxID=2607726 RepID=UPI00124E156B|nr:rod shape-determining protein MreD [Weizmannia acidilactici]GER66193.1 rod shape-determining protein MreD [Weizmannia acidilactici]
MKRAVLPLILSVCYIAESLFAQFFSAQNFGGKYIIVPHFLLVMLILMGMYYRKRSAIIYAFVFGMLFDAFYTGVLGIYLFFYPFAVYLTIKLMRILQSNIFTGTVVAAFNMAVVEFLVYGVNSLINSQLMGFSDFLNLRLWPTLIFNAAFFILAWYPMRNFLVRRAREEEQE